MTSSRSTYKNSASGSTKRLISHGQAIRSTLAFFFVTYFIVISFESGELLVKQPLRLQNGIGYEPDRRTGCDEQRVRDLFREERCSERADAERDRQRVADRGSPDH